MNDCQSQTFPVLWLNWTQTMEVKQNQTFFFGANSNLISFFIGCKILKCFNDFYKWHFSISLFIAKVSKTKQNKIKENVTCANLKAFFPTWKFLIRFILKMNDNCSGEKMVMIWFYSVNIIGNSALLAEKNSQARRAITTI